MYAPAKSHPDSDMQKFLQLVGKVGKNYLSYLDSASKK